MEEQVELSVSLEDEATRPLENITDAGERAADSLDKLGAAQAGLEKASKRLGEQQKRTAKETEQAAKASEKVSTGLNRASGRVADSAKKWDDYAKRVRAAAANVDGSGNKVTRMFGRLVGATSSGLGKVASITSGALGKVAGLYSRFGATAGGKAVDGIVGGISRAAPKIAEMTGKAIRGAANVAKAAGKAVGDAAGAALTAAVGAGAAVATKALSSGWDRANALQGTQASLNILMGDVAKAEKLTAGIGDAVSGTSFTMTEFADAGKKLAAFGVEADKVPKLLRAMGEAATASGKGSAGIEQMTMALGKAAAMGKIDGETVQSLADSGVPALKILGNKYKMTTAEMAKNISAGKVTADEAFDVLLDGIMSGSKGMNGVTVALGGTMENLRNTVEGAKSGVSPALARWGAEFWKPFLDDFDKDGKVIAGPLAGIINSFTGVINKATPIATVMGKVLEKMLPSDRLIAFFDDAAVKAEKFGKALQELYDKGGASAVLEKFAPALSGIGAAFVALSPLMAGFLRGIPLIGGLIPGISPIVAILGALALLAPNLGSAFGDMAGQLGGIFGELQGQFMELMPALMEALGGVGESVVGALSTIIPAVAGVLSTLLPVVMNLVTQLAPVFAMIVESVAPLIAQLLEGLAPALAGILEAVVPLVGTLIEGLVPVVVQLFEAFAPIISQLVDSLVPIIVSLLEALTPVILVVAQLAGTLLAALAPSLGGILQAVVSVLSILAPFLEILAAIVQVIGPLLVPVVSLLANMLSGLLAGALNIVAGIFRTVGDLLRGLTGFIRSAAEAFTGILGPALQAVRDFAQPLLDVLGAIGGALRDFASNPLGGLKDMLGFSGGGVVGYSGGGVAQFAGGGVTAGYAPGRDTMLAAVSPGEGILVPEVVKALGPGWVYQMNAAYSNRSPQQAAPSGMPVNAPLYGIERSYSDVTERFESSSAASFERWESEMEPLPADPNMGMAFVGGGNETHVVQEGDTNITVRMSGGGSAQQVTDVKNAVREALDEIERRKY